MNQMKNIKSSLTNISKVVIILIALTFSATAYSQTWSDVGGGACDFVNSSVVYNGELIIGGRFTCVGGVQANYIAKWDGTSWSALDVGMNGWVNALAVYDGFLIAGGTFTQAGSTPVNFLAKWDGISWTDVNGDMGNQVASLTVYNNDLIIGGYFTDADGFPANYIVGWNDNGWFNLGSGMGGMQCQVMALNVYGTDLIAAGFFTTAGGQPANHIAKWDGTSWSALGSGTTSIAYSLGVYNSDLIVGGIFLTAGGISTPSIAKWNGSSWSGLGTGIGATPVGYNYVFALTEYNGSLFAGGMYQTAGGINVNSIAKWDGTNWYDLNGGVQYNGTNVYAVNTLTVYNGDLYAGGIFSTAGAISASHIALWNEIPTAVENLKPTENKIILNNYPNPFIESTKVFFTLPESSNIRMVLTDISGREISVLLHEFKGKGDYEIELDSRKISMGIYILRLEADTQVRFLKLTKTN